MSLAKRPGNATPRRILTDYGVVVFATLVATLVRWLLDPLLGPTVPYITLFPAVVFAAWYGGFRPAILATLLGALGAWMLFIPKQTSLGPESYADIVGLSVCIAMGVAIAAMGGGLHASERRATDAEKISRLNSERLRITLASVGDAVIVTDEMGQVTYLNSVASTLTEWTAAEANGLALEQVFRIVNESTRQPVESPATKALREGVVVGLANHTVLISKTGVDVPIDDSAAPIRDEAGHTIGCVLVFRNVAAQRQAARDLQASEERKRSMFEMALDCIISMDHTGAIIEFNKAAEQTFGHSRDQVLGRDLADVIIPARYRESHRQGLTRYLSTGEGPVINNRLELSAMHADGRELSVELSVTAIPVDGPPVFTAFLRDITERQRASAAIAESEAFSRGVFESSPDCVKVLDADGHILRMNANGLCIMEIDDLTQFQGRPWADLWPEVARDEVRRALVTARTEHGSRFQSDCPTAKGTWKFWDVMVSPLLDAAGSVVGFVSVSRDITARREDEERLRQIAAELSEAGRRKDEFLATLAHELRNPLAPISNATRILQLTNSQDEYVRTASDMMERQVGQMVRLVDDLLDVSRISRGAIQLRLGHVEIGSIVHHAVEASKDACEKKGISLIVAAPATPLYVHADPTRLTQIVGNLVNNAVKFSYEGGKIWLSATKDNNGVVIRMRDDGIGIAEDQLGRIFDMFGQVDTSLERTQSGLGIGLTLVRRLLEMHGGTISVHSGGLGAGSEFVVRLPLATEKAASPSVPRSAPPTSKSRRVLVVDDNIDSATSLSTLLKINGHETRVAYDGVAAIDEAEAFRPELVLLDLGLPKMNGYEVARGLRQRDWARGITIVALTGWGQDEDRRKTTEAGFDRHLVKPVDYSALSDLLAAMST